MQQNIGSTERVISGVTAAGFAALAARSDSTVRRFAFGLASGALAFRAASGRCALKAGVTEIRDSSPIRVEKQTVINAPVEQVYEFWNTLENFPKFMDHIQSVVQVNDRRSHWVSDGPLGSKIEWDAETVKNVPNDVIEWKSANGTVEHRGSVRFKRIGPKTRVKIRLEYRPPAGRLGATVARLFGDDPRSQLEEYLKKAKALLDGHPSVEQIRRGALPKLRKA